MNPLFTDPDPYDDETCCPVIISLMQWQKRRKCEHAIGFKIYKCDLGVKSIDETYMKRHNSVRLTKWCARDCYNFVPNSHLFID